MNERIKELAEQARLYSRSFTYQQEVFEKKFAELIIQECIDGVYPEWMQEDGIELGGLADSVDRVKKRFGIKA